MFPTAAPLQPRAGPSYPLLLRSREPRPKPTEQEGASAESAFKTQLPPLPNTPKCKAATWYSEVEDFLCRCGPRGKAACRRDPGASEEEPADSTSLIVPSSGPGSSSHLGSRRVVSLRTGTAALIRKTSLDHVWSWNLKWVCVGGEG